MTTTPETLSTRLRAAADDIQFQGRPDPHDDKALLREAATECEFLVKQIERLDKRARQHAADSGRMFDLLFKIAALDPDDTQMSKVEFRGKVRDLAQQRMAPGVGVQPGEQWTELDSLRTSVAAYREHAHELGQYIVATHKPGQVDEAAVAILDGYHVGAREVAGGGAGEPGEHTLAAALRLLKLAASRGAFAPGQGEVIDAEFADFEEVEIAAKDICAGDRWIDAEGTRWHIIDTWKTERGNWAANAREIKDDAFGPTARECIAEWKPEDLVTVEREPVREDTSAACTGDVAPGAEAVETRFVELFYLSGPRVGLRFEGLPDVYIPDADADAIAKTLLSGGEHSAPSWKVISRAAEYFGQRVHVDSARGKLVLTDSSTYAPDPAREMLQAALQRLVPDDYASPRADARAALQRLGPTVAGVGGTVKLGAAIGIGPACGLSIDEFRPLLAAWNQVGSPRWSDEDLERRLVDRYAQLKVEFGQDLLDRGADRGPVAGPRETPAEPTSA